ncbi:MAG: hypothetical protein JO001_17845 [Alphaproteobacteria bacterium]|nr:hypothetical protein [Alphaproteobacteria bacterium]
MEKSNRRGKIPQSDWPLIMARYEAGETLASIARTYDCSPPAISYVVSRSRTRPGAAPVTVPRASEPILLKGLEAEVTEDGDKEHSTGNVVTSMGAATGQLKLLADAEEQPPTPPVVVEASAALAAHQPETAVLQPVRNGNGNGSGNGHDARHADARHSNGSHSNGNGHANGNGQANGEPRRTLHLSLGNAPPINGNAGQAADSPPAMRSDSPKVTAQAGPEPYHRQALAESAPRRNEAASENFAGRRPERDGYGDTPRAKESNTTYIDNDLRTRVNDDIAAFLAAFDAALVLDSQESRTGLREATDRLLRAGARTRIELERLEARIPLPPRDNGRAEPAWRHR